MKMYIAQKGIVFDSTKHKILVIKYLDAKYTSEKVKGKYGFPGGKMDFGEKPDETLVREIQEETGVTVTPRLPFHTYSWIYRKNDEDVQIVATSWLALYKSGDVVEPSDENETTLDMPKWINFEDLDSNSFVIDEQPVIEKLKEYLSNNPFTLS